VLLHHQLGGRDLPSDIARHTPLVSDERMEQLAASAFDHLRSKGVTIERGLHPEELSQVEAALGAAVPVDLATFGALGSQSASAGRRGALIPRARPHTGVNGLRTRSSST
jgi:hypothetical protein